MEESAVRLARHELRGACSAMVHPAGSEARPATPVKAFAGLAPPAFRSAPATAYLARRARRGQAGFEKHPVAPVAAFAGLGSQAGLDRACFPKILGLLSLSPSWPRREAGQLSRRSPPPPRQLRHLPPSADLAPGEGSANPN